MSEDKSAIPKRAIKSVQIHNHKVVMQKLKGAPILQNFLTLKYKLAVMEEEIKKTKKKAIEQYHEVFDSAKEVKSDLFTIELRRSSGTYTFSAGVQDLLEELSKLKERVVKAKTQDEKDKVIVYTAGTEILMAVTLNKKAIEAQIKAAKVKDSSDMITSDDSKHNATIDRETEIGRTES